MTRTWKNNLPSRLLVLSVLLFGATRGDAVVAQDSSGPLFPVPQNVPAAAPALPPEEPSPSANDDLLDVPVPAAPRDYWIVSSRRCPQSGPPRCTPAEFDYFRVDPEGQLRSSSLDSFQGQLDPDVPLCFVVHGSYTTWNALVRESAPVTRWLRSTAPQQPLQVVLFTWPSDPITTVLPAIDVAIFGQRASFNGFYLAQLVQQTPEGSRISFFAHSHGSRVVASALHLLDGGQLRGYQLRTPGRGRRALRPIFAAAAIDHHWLNPGERFGRALNQIDHGLVLHNQRDIALTIYPLRRMFSHRPLGLVGFDRLDRRLQNGRALKLAEVDVTPLIDTGHLWTHYFKQPQIAARMRPYLFFNENRELNESRQGAPANRVLWSSSTHAKNRPAMRSTK